MKQIIKISEIEDKILNIGNEFSTIISLGKILSECQYNLGDNIVSRDIEALIRIMNERLHKTYQEYCALEVFLNI